MSQASPSAPKRQLQMDGMRAMALLFVLVHHFGGPFLNHLNLGPFGVRFFFVVSGFLVTRILLKTRGKLDNGESSRWKELGNFQIRRLMRTLPAYYLSLLIAAAIGITPVRETLGWTLTFLTNFYIASVGYFPATISHFWTLAVQEQFYLFWPLIVLFLPGAWMKFTFPGLILTSLVFRYYCIATDASYLVRWFNVLGNLDTFAAGGILAYASMKNPALIVERKTRLWSGAVAFLCLFVAVAMRPLSLDNPLSILIELFESVFMGWLVACSVTGFRGWVGKILSWHPLAYLGQVSYGVFVYHVLISILLLPVFVHFGCGGEDAVSIVVRFFVQSLISILAATLSWLFFEQPLLQARKKIETWFLPKRDV